MTERLLKVLPLGVFGSLAFALVSINTAPAQEPVPLFAPGQQPLPGPRVAPLPALLIGGRAPVGQPDPVPLPLPVPGQPVQPAQPAQGDGIEVLARGPVHEAFASTAEAPVASPVVAKPPPEPIEELPPDQKPAGDNVQWIPGYWSWDEEGNQFIWVSGFWRQPPPGRAWIPGSWRDVKNGWQYVPGFWQELAPRQPQQPQQPQQPLAQVQPEIEYLPQPPQSLEIGPSNAAPSVTSVYVPGSWVWRHKYIWRPGVWVEYRADWVWTPARYHWTPAGYVFCDGYWDYPLATRGVLFAPVVVSSAVYTRHGFVYTPVYVVSEPCMTGALFVRRGHGSYYFGDYFEPRYATVGYSAWCGTVGRNGFAVGFGVGRTWGYDPLWSYYSVTYRENPRWHGGVNDLYAGRYRGDIARPPVTLVQQNTTINNITRTNVTNVTNNITVVNGAPTVGNKDVSNVAMVAPLKVAPDLTRTKFVPVSAESRHTEATAAKQIRDVGTQRTRLETAVVNQPRPAVVPGAAPVAVQPQTIKLDVPKAAAARAAVSTDERKAPPPNPLRTAPANPGAKIDPPKVNPPVAVQPPVTTPKLNPPVQPPVVAPKVNTPAQPLAPPANPVTPPVNPLPKADPKLPVLPPVTPLPKVEAPKVDPRLPVVPPVGTLPKVDPKLPVLPKVDPKPLPKSDPKPAPKGDPKPAPKGDPKPLAVAPPVAQPTPAPVAKPQAAPVVIAPPTQHPQPAPVVVAKPQPAPVVVAPAVQPKPVAIAPPVVQPKPMVIAPPVPTPQSAPVVVAKPQPQPAPVVVAPVVPPKPVAVAPPVVQPKPAPPPAPVVVAKPQPAPVVAAPPVVPPKPVAVAAPPAQPRPAAAPPAAPPVKVVQPAKPQPPTEQPKAQPAPPGKPVKKSREE